MTISLVRAIPALPVRSSAQSLVFYRDQLGFTVRHADAGFVILQRDAVEIHLWEARDETWQERTNLLPVVSGAESFIAGTASCRVQVTGVDVLYHEFQRLGIVHPKAPLSDQPWGTREFGILDPDNNLITFFERV